MIINFTEFYRKHYLNKLYKHTHMKENNIYLDLFKFADVANLHFVQK